MFNVNVCYKFNFGYAGITVIPDDVTADNIATAQRKVRERNRWNYIVYVRLHTTKHIKVFLFSTQSLLYDKKNVFGFMFPFSAVDCWLLLLFNFWSFCCYCFLFSYFPLACFINACAPFLLCLPLEANCTLEHGWQKQHRRQESSQC